MAKSSPGKPDVGDRIIEASVFGLKNRARIRSLVAYLLEAGCVPDLVYTVDKLGKLIYAIDLTGRAFYVQIFQWGRQGQRPYAMWTIFPDVISPHLKKRVRRAVDRHEYEPFARPVRVQVTFASHAKKVLSAS